MAFLIRSIFLKLVALLRGRPYLRLFLIARVLPQTALIISSLFFIHGIVAERAGLNRIAILQFDVRDLLEAEDINFHRARSILTITFRKVQYYPSLTEAPIRYPTIGIIRANVGATNILLLVVIVSSLAVILGTAYYSAYVTLDVFGESEDKNWPVASIHRITRQTNMWIMLVPSLIIFLLYLVLKLFAGTSASMMYIVFFALLIAGAFVIYRILFTLISRLLDANSLTEGATRSWSITRGRYWQTVALTLLFGLPGLLATVLLWSTGVGQIDMVHNPGALFTILSYTIPGAMDLDAWMVLGVAFLGELLVSAIMPVMLTLLYLDFARNEMWQEWLGNELIGPIEEPNT